MRKNSYLYELEVLLQQADDGEGQKELLCQEFWRYSILPQLCDLLDSTGRASQLFESMNLGGGEWSWKKYHNLKIVPPNERTLESLMYARTLIEAGPINQQIRQNREQNYTEQQEIRARLDAIDSDLSIIFEFANLDDISTHLESTFQRVTIERKTRTFYRCNAR